MQDGKAVKVHAQAELRVSKVLRDLRQIGKLSRYEFSELEVTQIFNAIRGELDAVQGLFTPQQKPQQPEFRFD